MRKVLAAILGTALVAAPLAANGADFSRASEPVAEGSELAANSNLLFIIGVAAVAAGIILLQEDEEGAPISA